MLLAQVVVSDMPSPLVMKALPKILIFPIVLIITLIISLNPIWTFAAFTGFTAVTTTFATLLCKGQMFRSEPILAIDCRFYVDERGDGLIGGGGHHGVCVHHELQEDCSLVVPWDPAKEVDDVLLLTHLGNCLCIPIGVGVGSIRDGSSCFCPFCAEIVMIDFPIDPQSVVVDISAVLYFDAPKVFTNFEHVELQL